MKSTVLAQTSWMQNGIRYRILYRKNKKAFLQCWNTRMRVWHDLASSAYRDVVKYRESPWRNGGYLKGQWKLKMYK